MCKEMSSLLKIAFMLFLRFTFSNSGCAPLRYDIAFYLVRDEQVTDTQFSAQIDFAKKVVSSFSVGYTRTRFSCHVYGSSAKKKFNFVEELSSAAVNTALDGAKSIGQSGYLETINNVKYIWNTIFSVDNGDRADVPNYCLMITTGENNDTYSLAGDKKPSTIILRVIDAQAAYPYKNYYSNNQYSKFSDYTQISAISTDNLNTEAAKFTKLFPCNYFCDTNYVAYDEPDLLKANNDTSRGKLYLLTDTAWDITCCGVISSWIFYAANSGTIKIGVFRPNGTNHYRLIGFNTIIIPTNYIGTVVNYPNDAKEKIAIKEGDKIGWHSSGDNIISYATCSTTSRSDCPQSTLSVNSSSTIAAGDTVDFAGASAIKNRAYSLKFTTQNNTALIIRTSENSTEIEENSAAGKQAILMTIVDPDAYEDLTFTVTGNTDYLELNQEKMTLDLKKKLPKGGLKSPLVVTITGSDTCQHTATVTLKVSSYNAPPVINNLPFIVEILETTKTAVPLYKIDVTDATNDDICCTMPFIIPNSYNFELKNITNNKGNEELWLYTVKEPAFEYSDIDQFRVFVCCQDPYGSSFSYLILRLKEVKEKTPYVPPDWFYRALIISLTPISIMTLVACFILMFTIFWL